MSEAPSQDLTVKGESIERVYGLNSNNRYIVNRRYQRKIIWTQEEKISFIDSIIRGYPVPIILLAEERHTESGALEIIDGMQRLNAVVSFIENDYMTNGGYFDLNTMAVTKAALDAGRLEQKSPVLNRDVCVSIAAYQLPFSIYEFARGESVDEVFRRINSGGRKLSRQELRAAGSTGHFAQVVRRIAAKIRGDDSSSDTLTLNDMKKISITNKELDYGIAIESLFWVSNGILTKDQVRESRDEELIADVVSFMVLDPPPSSRSEFIDDFFNPSEEETSKKRFSEIESAVQKRSVELVIKDFLRTFDELSFTISQSGKSFGHLIFDSPVLRSPRYFQVVFLAYYDLIVRKRKKPQDQSFLIQKMAGSHSSIPIPEGGRWGAEQRQDVVNGRIGVYERGFIDDNTVDPAVVHWVSQLQNILTQSFTEQSLYDFKQGFTLLDESNEFDENNFEKILITCSAIANNRRDARGYVLVGVAEKVDTAKRVQELYKTPYISVDRFFVTGVEHEATVSGKNLDQHFQLIVEKVKNSKLSDELKGFIVRNIKPVRYYDKTVYVFEINAQVDPSFYDGKYYERSGSQVSEINGSALAPLFKRFVRI